MNAQRGRIEVIFGPMFSGKSTELLRRIRRYKHSNKNCVVIKYARDVRYDEDNMTTHDQQKIEAIPAVRLYEAVNLDSDYEVIGIDEAQFFEDTVEFCENMAQHGKIVVVAALDGTYQRKVLQPFGRILELVPIAEKVTKLTSVCSVCFEDASFSKRIIQADSVEFIGGAESYIPVCRECFEARYTANSSPGKVGN